MGGHRVLLEFPEVFDVVDIEHPQRLDWRRCSLFILLSPHGKASLYAKVRNKTTGRHPHDLFEGVFAAGLESLARTVLSEVPGLREPQMLGAGFLYRGGNRGYSHHKGSALFSYQLPDHVTEALLALQGHTTLQVLDRARRLARHQARIRAAAPG
jgi:hypothetical protein